MSNRENIPATKDDFCNYPLPSDVETFQFKRYLSLYALSQLKLGHVPQEMEDRWFSYYENGCLHIFRSWSGSCIYVVELNESGTIHKVTVNRDPEQYSETEISADIEQLNELFDWWIGIEPKMTFWEKVRRWFHR